jgi:hypothetical protein
MYTWRGLLAPMLEWITPRLTAAAHQGSGQPVPVGKPLPVSAGKPHPVPAGKPQPGPAAKALGAAGRHRP